MVVEHFGTNGRTYGIAWGMYKASNDFESSAYAVINRTVAAKEYTLAHEFGHIMGANHDWAKSPTRNPNYPYNHGYVNTSPTPPSAALRTIMANGYACNECPRVLQFSNPKVNYMGDPTGVATEPQPSDNHRVLN